MGGRGAGEQLRLPLIRRMQPKIALAYLNGGSGSVVSFEGPLMGEGANVA